MENKGVFDSVLLASLLSGVGGFLDAYSFTMCGGVLATAQTGNMIFLCVGLAQKDFLRVAACFLPILAFSLGVLTSLFCEKNLIKNEAYFATAVLAAQGLVLCIIPLISADFIANALISYACGAQVAVFRTIRGNTYATTMCTGNLRAALENGFKYVHTKEKQHKAATLTYMLIIFSFLLGAYMSALLAPITGRGSVAFAAVILLLCAAISFNKRYKPN